MMPVKRTYTWRSSAEQLRHKAPARSCRRRHNGTATDTRTAQRRLPKLLHTGRKRRHRATGERGKGRRMPRAKIGTDNSAERVKAHLTAHREHPHTAADGTSKEAASTKRRQAARRPGKTLRTQKGPRNRRKQMVVNGKRLSAWKLPGELAAISSADKRCVVPDSAEPRR